MQEMIVLFTGRVQGVGFRATIRRYALHFKVTGSVRNLPNGSVELIAQGEKEVLQALVQAIQNRPRGARLTSVEILFRPIVSAVSNFRVLM